MSNPFCLFVYGCSLEDIPEETLLELEFASSDEEVGCHSTYDQSEDLRWFGVRFDQARSGIRFSVTLDHIPSLAQRTQVNKAFGELPEEVQTALGSPRLLTILGVD